MSTSLLYRIDGFLGINNVADSFQLLPQIDISRRFMRAEMLTLQNVDISTQYSVSIREGNTLELFMVGIHSLWAEGDICLFVSGNNLYQLSSSYTPTLLYSGLIANTRMTYVKVNDRIYMTNGFFVGYYSSSAISALPSPVQKYKLPLPAGKFIRYYRGCLYVARGNVLYISDALCDHYDIRIGYRAFSGDITLLEAVDDGLYVSDGCTWFISGKGADEFERHKVVNEDAIPYTAAVITGEDVGEDGISETVVFWVSTAGICVGMNRGKIKFITRGKYSIPSGNQGCSMIRKQNGQVHYIVILNG